MEVDEMAFVRYGRWSRSDRGGGDGIRREWEVESIEQKRWYLSGVGGGVNQVEAEVMALVGHVRWC